MDSSTSIAFLGPDGTYSEEAAFAFVQRMGHADVRFVACTSFHDVFEEVSAGRAEYGVVALENSIEGAVTAVLDDFARSEDIQILGEQIIDVHHCLLLHPDASLEDIDTVASHPQGIAQCRRYLREHFPDCTVLTTSSTSESARLAATHPHIASIASARAGEAQGARIADCDIEDHDADQTAFALIARKGAPQVLSGAKAKTSLALFLKSNRPGALLMILSEFSYVGINLTKIQSRPTKRALGEYMFFVDVDGSIDDEEVATALTCLRLKLRTVKVLGSYPVD